LWEKPLLEKLFYEATDSDTDNTVIGYSLSYEVKVNDKNSPPPIKIKAALERAVKNFAWPIFKGLMIGTYNIIGGVLDGIINSGVVKDLTSLHIKTKGSGDLNIGKAVDTTI
jgi:hypothetical protein